MKTPNKMNHQQIEIPHSLKTQYLKDIAPALKTLTKTFETIEVASLAFDDAVFKSSTALHEAAYNSGDKFSDALLYSHVDRLDRLTIAHSAFVLSVGILKRDLNQVLQSLKAEPCKEKTETQRFGFLEEVVGTVEDVYCAGTKL